MQEGGKASALAGALVAHLCKQARARPRRHATFACPACGDVLQRPVTAACGHTCCGACARARCPACGARAPGPAPSTNVLVQVLVERWWSGELLSARAAQEADRLLTAKRDPDAALAKCNKALHFSPTSHQLLAVRCQVFNSLSRYSEALDDADTVVSLRPTWSKGHFAKGIVLFNLNLPEEALVSFCISASLGHSTPIIRRNVNKCLSRLLSSSKRRRHCRKSAKLNSDKIHRLRSTMARNNMKLSNYHLDCKRIRSNTLEISYTDRRESECGIRESFEFHVLIENIFNEVNKYSDMSPSSTELQVESILVYQSDFECVLCSRSLWRPVTTPCGHTYCMHCLERCLDYSYSCPLCKTSLSNYHAEHHKSITTFIDEAMRSFIPTEYIARRISHTQEIIGASEREPQIPVFICTAAFPTVSCPLFVFEPRYRLMVRRCLESGSKQFGIAACCGANKYAEFGTVLEIKDCVLMANGCSILSTVGVKRFRVIARGERDGYDMARIETIQDNLIEEHREQAVIELHEKVRIKAWLWFKDMDIISKKEIIQSFGHMPDEEEQWKTQRDGPSWTWWVVAILPLAIKLKVMILSTPDLEKRLRAIDRTLDYIYFLAKKQTSISDRAIAFTNPPPDYCSSPWIFNQSASTSQLGEQSM